MCSHVHTHLHGLACLCALQDAKYSLQASYLEIYNEGIFDLLNLKARNLPVKWDPAQGFFVPGLKTVVCKDNLAMMEVRRRV